MLCRDQSVDAELAGDVQVRPVSPELRLAVAEPERRGLRIGRDGFLFAVIASRARIQAEAESTPQAEVEKLSLMEAS
jgi:hypothetical protein